MDIRGYMAVSMDGYIADKDGGVGWLDRVNGVEAGYDRFIAGIGTVVFGRTTYEQSLILGGGWSYPGKRGIVVTGTPLADPPPGVERWSAGVPALIAHLREMEGDAAWIVGGAALQSAFIDARALDTLDMFVVPVLLGSGVRMFPPSQKTSWWRLEAAEALGKGLVRLAYRRP